MVLIVKRQSQDQEVCTGANITLECEVDKDGASATWRKNGQLLSENDRIKMSQSGKIFTLTISKAQASDEGMYTTHCVKRRLLIEDTVQSTVRVTVKKEFEQEWRTINWDKDEMMNKIYSFKPKKAPLHILVHGPIGAGKSSLINSIDSIFKGRISTVALADGTSGRSFTANFKTYKFWNSQHSSPLPFVISDTMGLEETGGMHSEDITSILKGHIMEDVKFSQDSPLSEGNHGYKQNPSLTDKVHCLVSVLPADKISLMKDVIFEKMRTIREKARDLKIPQVVLMTRVDEACPLVKTDLKKIYSSMKIRQKMQECHFRLGVPMNCIYPVKNYHEEISLSPDEDCVILEALKHILDFADDHMTTLLTPTN